MPGNYLKNPRENEGVIAFFRVKTHMHMLWDEYFFSVQVVNLLFKCKCYSHENVDYNDITRKAGPFV